jgi:Arc/MetJ-type ribon-helix-helix transcriptional regulator
MRAIAHPTAIRSSFALFPFKRSWCLTRVAGIHIPSTEMVGMIEMADNVRELRPKAAESEKITINLGYVDLGHIDLMVQDGFYSNRTDFIRTAIRNQLDRHTDAVKQSVARKKLDLGIRHYTREELEAVEAAGETVDIQVLGLASIAPDVTPELARAPSLPSTSSGLFMPAPP